MPFVPNMQDEENQPNAQGAVAPAGGGAVHLAPSSGVGAAGPAGASATPAGGAGGSFATLDKYLSANQGQAEPLAGQITNQIGQQYSGLDKANQGVLTNIQGQVTNAPGYTASDPNVLAQEAANPVSFAGDNNNVASFQKQLTDSYGGPSSAESDSGYQKQQAAVNNAIAQGQAQTTTEAGRKQLLSQNEATPTTGVTALNSAILSQDPNSLGKIESAYQPFQNLVSNLNTGAQDINKTIAQEQSDAAAASQAAQGQLTGQMSGLNTAVNNQLTTAQQNATKQNATLKSDVSSGNVTPSDLQLLGMSQDQWNSLSAADKAAATSEVVSSNQGQFQANTGTTNIDNTQFLTQQDPNAVLNAGNTATADQYKQAQAFQSLLNGLNLQTPQLVINPANAAQAGTAPTSFNTFDANTALTTAQQTGQAERTAAQAYVDAIQAGADEEHAQLAAANAQKNMGITTAGNPMIGATLGTANNIAQTAPGNIVQAFTNPSIKNTMNLAETQGKAVLGGVSTAVNDAVNTVSNIFCFHPDTRVEMANGGTKAICKIKIGDETRGGKVVATTRGLGQGFYWYFGVLVTGKHAVKEDGIWVRVENSKNGREFKYLTEVVCNLVTEKHRIWANGIEFADEHENDNYENLNLQQSLDALNQNG